ncbi:D-2-hydroxyacid dehydrogenase family protein [Pokkaliibacter sp. CJK22405]|uniref:D-2-hydroxyacid dehydrogenase family protein n=1 Tax=Pokkaliibacter sp. CJK22405 TaxID=3384615 RepID=UPI003984CD72
MKIVILDDYQDVAMSMADWSAVKKHHLVQVFNQKLEGEALLEALADADVICAMRERTRFDDNLLRQLPQLKLLITSGMRNSAIDMKAARALNIPVCGTPNNGAAAFEMTWALMLSLVRKVALEDRRVRAGQWQTTIGGDLKGKTLGIIGLGKLGQQMVPVAKAFGMKVMAWSPNLTEERAMEADVLFATKAELLSQADIVTLHMKLSDRTRSLLDTDDIARMKPSALLINTSRGPLVNEQALITALQSGAIAGAALDVFDIEPLPAEHPLTTLDNTVLTSHVGFVTENTYRLFYEGMVEAVKAFLKDEPIRVLN